MPGQKPSLLPFGFVVAAFALFFAFSLPHVFDPPIGTHGWRQAIATSEARLYAAGQPFLYPRAEGCGDEPNLSMGSEFPLYAWTLGKLGGENGINLVGRLLGILSALGLMLATFALVRLFFARWEEPYRSLAAVAAGSFFAVSPLFRFYGISFVPDLEAHALALLGIAIFAGPIASRDEEEEAGLRKPLTPLRFFIGAALISLACLTKLIVLPHLALAGVVLLDRCRAKDGLVGFKAVRPWLFAALLLVIVFVPVWLWYVRWVPVLKHGGCEMVWLPESMDDSWKTMTLTDPEWRLRMAKWGSEDLLGPVWIACLAGLPLFLFAGLRGGLLLLWSIGCMLGFVRLGWHTKQHDYDFLLVLPAFAAGFGASFALLARLAARLLGNRLQRTPDWLKKGAPYIALALVLAALSPGAHKQSRRHFYTGMDEVGLQEKLDKVLPRGEAIHYLGGKNDPRVPYYANRRAWGTEAGLYCLRREVKYDCLLGAGPEGGRLSPCIERAPAVAWSTGALTCDILHPERPLVPARVLTTVATHIRFPKDQNFPGVGHLYGSDPVACGTWKVPCAGNLERIEFFDFYFVPEVNAPPVQLLADGTPLSVKPEPSRWTAGTLIVARAELPKGAAPAKLELKVQESVVPLTEK